MLKYLKLTTITSAAFAVALASVAQAGTPIVDYKSAKDKVIVPEERIGVGPYIALFGGSNLHQNADLDNADLDAAGLDLDFNTDLEQHSGWFAGLKVGYVFETHALILPAIELEAFYNDHVFGADFHSDDLGGIDVETDRHFKSVPIMLNFIAKFDLGKFRPYIGVGAGITYVDIEDPIVDIEINGAEVVRGQKATSSGDTDWVFSYQAIGGFDWYLTKDFALFAEYKALVYHDLNTDPESDNYLQHLVGGGIRWHF